MANKKKAAVQARETIVAAPVSTVSDAPKEQANPWHIYGFRFQAIALGLIAFLFYCNTFSNEWAYDDMLVIVQNEYVHQGIAGIPKLFNADAFESYGRSQNEENNQLTGGRYRPLSMVTFAIEQQILGLDHTDFSDTSKAGVKAALKLRQQKLNSDMHFRHVVNVLLYALSIVVLLLFLRKIVFPTQPLAAFLAALLFAVHPLHTEVVANVKSRDEIMSLLFVCLTFTMAFKYLDNKKLRDLIWACIWLLLALLSKEYAVVMIVLIPLSFFIARNYSPKQSITSALPYLAPLVIYLMLRLSAVKPGGDGLEGDIMNHPYAFATASEKIASEIAVLLNYLRLLIFPHPLTSEYTYNQIPYVDFGNVWVWVSFAVHATLVWLLVRYVKKRHMAGFAIAFYLFFLLLVSNLVVNIGAPMGERLIYHSSVGFAILVALVLQQGYTYLKEGAAAKAVLAALMTIIVVASGIKTIARNADWKNNATLFLKDVNTSQNSVIANTNAGMACIEYSNNAASEDEQRKWTLKAIPYLDKAISINNQYVMAHLNRGQCYLKLGQMDRASDDCDSVQKYFPTLPALAYLSYAVTTYYINEGLKLAGDNKPVEAIAAFKRASDATPTNPDLLYNLAFAYCKNNQLKEGRAALAKLLQMKPDHAQARGLMAQLDAQQPR